jgi:monoamine oxidase
MARTVSGSRSADSCSIGDRIDELGLPEVDDDLLRGIWAIKYSAPPDEIALTQALRDSAAVGIRTHSSSTAYRVAGGIAALAQRIAEDSGGEIRLKAAVRSIEQSRDGVAVCLDGGIRYLAEQVVLTLPLNVISTISFTPGLSAAKHAISRQGQASQGLKTWVRVRGDSLRDTCFMGGPDLPLTLAKCEYSFEDDCILCAFGPRASRLRPTDRHGIQEALRLWQPGIDVVDVTGHDWVRDPYARETWLALRPRQWTSYFAELQKPEDRIHLAGSDVASSGAGFIEGAIHSGLAVARRLTTDS